MKSLETQHEARREANLVAYTLHGGLTVYSPFCYQCGRKFLCNEDYVKWCSDSCLSKYLSDRGLIWFPETTPEGRWEIEPPGIVHPETLLLLRKWAETILTATVNMHKAS